MATVHKPPTTSQTAGAVDEPLVGYDTAAAYLGVAVGTLYCWVSTKRVKFYRIGPRCIRFKLSDLKVWLDGLAVEPSGRAHQHTASAATRGGVAPLPMASDDGLCVVVADRPGSTASSLAVVRGPRRRP